MSPAHHVFNWTVSCSFNLQLSCLLLSSIPTLELMCDAFVLIPIYFYTTIFSCSCCSSWIELLFPFPVLQLPTVSSCIQLMCRLLCVLMYQLLYTAQAVMCQMLLFRALHAAFGIFLLDFCPGSCIELLSPSHVF